MTQLPLSPSLSDVRRALSLPDFDVEAAWLHMAPRGRKMQRPIDQGGKARSAAVLLLLYPHEERLCFFLTQRAESLNSHSGQISLPGGAQDSDETIKQTALRETCEELDICGIVDEVEIIGQLTNFYLSVSDFQVYPVIAYLPRRPEPTPNPDEVAAVIEFSLPQLLDHSIKETEVWTLRDDEEYDIPFYRVAGQPLWGATAVMLSEFEWRLRATLGIG